MRFPLITAFALCLLLPVAAPAASTDPGDGWETWFELSGGLETPRYEETRDYCRRLADASPLITMTSFGTSPHGRDLMLLVADRDGLSTPDAVRARGGVVLLIQACIHAGESDGKDAGLMLLRDMAIRGERAELLDHVTIVFMPMFNVDGHERFGPLNRANQNGPAEMGWRVTSRNLNLNRDYLKADSVEMRAWLEVFGAWLPDFFIDAHVSDGADFQYTLMYDLPVRGNMGPGLTRWARDAYLPSLRSGLDADGWPLLEYGGFRRWHDPLSGINVWLSGPRYSHGYAAIRNRPGLLLETHMLKPYAERVAASHDLFVRTLQIMNRDHLALRRLTLEADERAASAAFRAQDYPLTFHRDPADSVMIDFLGYEYEMVESPVTGGRYPVFHRDRPRAMRIPMFGTFRPEATVRPPEAYLVPPQWTEVIDVLERHGAVVERLAEAVELETVHARFRDVDWNERPFEGRHRLTYDVSPETRTDVWPAGTAVVDLAQPASGAVLHALAPEGPDALVRWGFFDAIFERKEYIESYVFEPMLPGMLADDPELAAAWEQARTDDPTLADDHWRSLLWFYERSEYWDRGIGLYPVGRLEDRAVLGSLPLVR